MKSIAFPMLLLLATLSSSCQQRARESAPVKNTEVRTILLDSTLTEAYTRALNTFEDRTGPGEHFGDTIVDLAMVFLDAPYESGTLDKGPKEELVLNLSAFDCTTFVEQVLALGLALRTNPEDPQVWVREVERLRYRRGQCRGYGSRLHYFSEWLLRASARGILEYPPKGLRMHREERTLDFMTSHRSAYSRLAPDSTYARILEAEEMLRRQPLYSIPVSEIGEQLEQMRQGDIVAFATSIDGLDVTHTGFVYKEGKTTKLLHASSTGSVRISALSLDQYAARLKNCTGILIARPR